MGEQWREARLLERKVTAGRREELAPTAFSLKGEENNLIGHLHPVNPNLLCSLSSPSVHISLEDDGCGAAELRCLKRIALPFRKLAVTVLPAGFAFDKFGLLVRKEKQQPGSVPEGCLAEASG